MNIQEVITNLDRTIVGKNKYLQVLIEERHSLVEFVRANINELNRIRTDLIKVRDGI